MTQRRRADPTEDRRRRRWVRAFGWSVAALALFLLVGRPWLWRDPAAGLPEVVVFRRPQSSIVKIGGADVRQFTSSPQFVSCEGGDSDLLLDPQRVELMWSIDPTTRKLGLSVSEALGFLDLVRLRLSGSTSSRQVAWYRETTPFNDGDVVRLRREPSRE